MEFWSLILLIIFTLCSYISVIISPSIFWPAGLVSHLIPVFLVINIAILLVLAVFKRKTSMVPLLLLLIGWPFISRTISLSFDNNEPKDLTILSYNVKLFRKPGAYDKFSTDLIKWVANDTAQIKCLQEYSSNSNWEVLDASSQIKSREYYSFIFKADVIDNEHNPGLAIFSKYKIINSGVVFQEKHTVNAAIFADIEINKRVVRIYNVHLASMNLELENSIENKRLFRTIRRLKSGTIKRIEQVEILINHLKKSPYPVIINGDFNETPYSYVYNRLSDSLQNSFEEAGNGFGFTFNDIPYLLRIDHQFHSEGIKAVKYKVSREMRISDHLPTYGYYFFEN